MGHRQDFCCYKKNKKCFVENNKAFRNFLMSVSTVKKTGMSNASRVDQNFMGANKPVRGTHTVVRQCALYIFDDR